jgi:hypothetical protein
MTVAAGKGDRTAGSIDTFSRKVQVLTRDRQELQRLSL